MYIAARNEQKALDAIKRLETEGIEDGKLEWLKLDLSDPRLAKQAAKEFLEKESRLDILGACFCLNIEEDWDSHPCSQQCCHVSTALLINVFVSIAL